jgi:hypothetical protein
MTSKNSSMSSSPATSLIRNSKAFVLKDGSTISHSRTRGKFPRKNIVPITGNKGMVDYKHMRELQLQEMKSNYSRDSLDDDKMSQTFIKHPKMQTLKRHDDSSRN